MDKNGVMTTKWVLPPSEGSAGRSNFPPPVAPPKSSMIYSPKHGKEIDIKHTEFSMLFERSMLKYSGFRIEELDRNIVQTLEYMVQEAEGKDHSSMADSAVTTACNIVSSRMEMGDHGNYTALNNLAVFGEAVMQPQSRSYEVQSLVMGLGQGDRDFLLDATEEEREAAITLVTAASRIKGPLMVMEGDYYSDNRTVKIASDALADFILSRPDDVERIAQVVNERSTDDVDVIRDVLDHPQQALRDGAL